MEQNSAKRKVILTAKREEENEVRKGKGRGYGNIQSLQRSPKKGILDPADA